MGVSLKPLCPIANLLLAYLKAVTKPYFYDYRDIAAMHNLPESRRSAIDKNLYLLLFIVDENLP